MIILAKETIEQIEKRLILIENEADPYLAVLEKDERKGVHTLIDKWRKQTEKVRFLTEKFHEMSTYERKYRPKGFS